MGQQNKKSEDVQELIASISYQAYSQPWPSKSRDGVRGRENGIDGARAARVLAGVLVVAWRANSLTVVTGLEPLGYEIGLVSHYPVRDALYDLQELGWLEFEVGTQDDWSPGGEPGRPSVITLVSKPSNSGLCPLDLPLLTLDMFREGEKGLPGSAGWLAATRIWFECREDRFPNPTHGVSEVVRLTGMNQSRVKRLLPQMAEIGLAQKEGAKYRFGLISHLNDRSAFTDYKRTAHNERLAANRKQKDDGPVVPQLWELDSSGVYYRIREPLGYFESGRAYWTEAQHRLGDPGPRKWKRLLIPRFVKSRERRLNVLDHDEVQYLPVPHDAISDEDLLAHIVEEQGSIKERSERSYADQGPTHSDPDLLLRVRGYTPPKVA